MIIGAFTPPTLLTPQELVAKFEGSGYPQIRDVKSTAEGTAVWATATSDSEVTASWTPHGMPMPKKDQAIRIDPKSVQKVPIERLRMFLKAKMDYEGGERYRAPREIGRASSGLVLR